jgi:hypothetical protein
MIPDPEQERQRLDRLYSGMTPELESVAADGAELTDAALETLKTEISRRGLAITVNEIPAGVDVLEERDLVGIRLFLNLPEALLAKSRLESAGIECFLMDGNMVRINWSNLVGGAKLLVNREDADAATAILDERIPANPGVEGVGEPGDSEQG